MVVFDALNFVVEMDAFNVIVTSQVYNIMNSIRESCVSNVNEVPHISHNLTSLFIYLFD